MVSLTSHNNSKIRGRIKGKWLVALFSVPSCTGKPDWDSTNPAVCQIDVGGCRPTLQAAGARPPLSRWSWLWCMATAAPPLSGCNAPLQTSGELCQVPSTARLQEEERQRGLVANRLGATHRMNNVRTNASIVAFYHILITDQHCCIYDLKPLCHRGSKAVQASARRAGQ